MVCKSLIRVLLIAMLVVLPWSGAVAEKADLHEWGNHADKDFYEGAIVIKAPDGTRKVTTVLGGQLGKETVDGINVGVFVLQAENPEQLKPGAKGPTHIFNVAFIDEASKCLLEDVAGTVVISGAGAQQRVAMRPFKSHFQVLTRLNQPGDYDIHVEFAADGRSGTTHPVRFTYRQKTASSRAGHSHHMR